METPKRFCVLFRSGTPDEQLLRQAVRAWFANASREDPSLVYDPAGKTEFEVIPHFFDTESVADFERCVKDNAQYMFQRSPDSLFCYKGVILWPSEDTKAP